MRVRMILCIGICAFALSANEAAAAASPVTELQTPAELRRAERLRKRLRTGPTRAVPRSDAAEERRQARLLARSRTRRPVPNADGGMSVTERVLALVNDARADKGLDPLETHPALEKSAQAYAEDMAARGFFSHDDPEGGTPRDRIHKAGYTEPTCHCSWMYGTGENLAQGQDTAEKAVRDWLASPGHRANILRRDFTDTGIGYFDEHWVQHFGVSKVLP